MCIRDSSYSVSTVQHDDLQDRRNNTFGHNSKEEGKLGRTCCKRKRNINNCSGGVSGRRIKKRKEAINDDTLC